MIPQETLGAIIVDTETTDIKDPEVIEMAWVEIADVSFERVENINCDRFKPTKPMTLGAIATHHILPSDLTYCQPFDLAYLPKSTYLIGHNIDFDWTALGKPPGKRICTLALARRIWPELDSHSLTALFYFVHGVNELSRDVVRNAHSALHDVAMTHQILRHIVEKMQINSLDDLYALSESARIPTHMTFGKYKGTPIKDVDKGYVKWYRAQPDTDPYLLIAFSRAGK
jgi:exodeoxyribonuclease X